MTEEMEMEVVKALRVVAQHKTNLAGAVSDSIAPSKILLTDIARRLELKSKNLKSSQLPVPMSWMNSGLPYCLWMKSDKISAKDLTPLLVGFFTHCYREGHYLFEVMKCARGALFACKPPRLPLLEFFQAGTLT